MQVNNLEVSRRSLLKWGGAVAGGAALVGTAAGAVDSPAQADGMQGVDKTVWSACLVNCGSRCPLRLQVKDGIVVRVLPDNSGTNELGSQQIRACPRGRTARQRIYNPDRLKKPMRRKPGTKRGDGQWETSTEMKPSISTTTRVSRAAISPRQAHSNGC